MTKSSACLPGAGRPDASQLQEIFHRRDGQQRHPLEFGNRDRTQGRYEDCLILPFSFREFLRFRKIEWTPALLATPEVGLVLKAFDEYLRYGGFPEQAGFMGEVDKRRLLQSYFDTIFYKTSWTATVSGPGSSSISL